MRVESNRMGKRQNHSKWNEIKTCVKHHWPWAVFMVICLILTGSFRAAGSACIEVITDHIQNVGMEGLWTLIFFTAAIQFVNYSTKFLAAYSSTRLKNQLIQDIRMKLSDHFLKIPFAEYETIQSGNLQSLMRNDVKTAGNTIYVLFSRIGTSVFTAIFSFFFMLNINWEATVTVLLISLIFGVLNQKILKNIKGNEKKSRDAQGAISSFLVNGYETVDSVKAFRGEGYMRKRFLQARKPYEDSQVNIRKLDSARMGFYNIVNNGALFGSAIYLAVLTLNGKATIGDVLAFIALLNSAMMSVEMIFRWTASLIESDSAWDRIFEAMEIKEMKSEGRNGEDMAEENGKIGAETAASLDVEDLTFSYGNGKEESNYQKEESSLKNVTYGLVNRPIFAHQNFHFEKGILYGITGESGSGKSTLLKCIMGLYRAKGALKVDDHIVDSEDITEKFAFVASDLRLFTGTLYENLTLGDDGISQNQCMKMAEGLGIYEWIEHLPKGLDSEVKEGGSNFSGGQRQMICILRAFLSDKPFLILDEPFSALDQTYTKYVKQALEQEKRNRVIIMTSHRTHTMDMCDKIYSLN